MTPERFRKLKAVLGRRQPDLTVLADRVHKSHNIAAVLRTCDAVGIYRMHAVSPGGEIRRHHTVSSGTQRWMHVVVHRDIMEAIDVLRAERWQLVAAHPGPAARDFREVDYTQKVAVVLGAELAGLSDAALRHADATVAIPMQGMVASLNVSVAAALILYEAQRQRAEAGLYERSRLDPDEAARTLFEWAYPRIASRCRRHGRPYPALSEDGRLLGNPLAELIPRDR